METMGKTREIIIKDIENYIVTCPGKFYTEFYIGITNNPVKQLFTEHHVDKGIDYWTYHKAIDKKTALSALQYFIHKGMKAGSETGDDSCIYVYCYRIADDTIKKVN